MPNSFSKTFIECFKERVDKPPHNVNNEAMISPNTKIVVSNHARQRMVERFDRFIPPYGNDRELNIVICKMVRSGHHIEEWKRVPFYYHSVSTKNGGPGTEFVSYNNEFIFICNYNTETDTLLVVTVVWKMLYFPMSGHVAFGGPGGARFISELKLISGLQHEAMVEYRQRHGDTPLGLFIQAKKEAKATRGPKIDNMAMSRLGQIDKTLRGNSAYGVKEHLYLARKKLMVHLGLHSKEEDVKMFTDLIELCKSKISKNADSKAIEDLARYEEELQKLTVDNTEN